MTACAIVSVGGRSARFVSAAIVVHCNVGRCRRLFSVGGVEATECCTTDVRIIVLCWLCSAEYEQNTITSKYDVHFPYMNATPMAITERSVFACGAGDVVSEKIHCGFVCMYV